MHIWTIPKWEKTCIPGENCRSGLRLRFDKGVDPEVKRALKEFAKWLRTEYYFPVRVPAYIKAKKKIKAMDGDLVYGTFLEPSDSYQEPYIRIAVGDYNERLEKQDNKDDVLASYLRYLAHELTHYYQWVNGLKLTPMGEERQATSYEWFILDEYADIREHS